MVSCYCCYTMPKYVVEATLPNKGFFRKVIEHLAALKSETIFRWTKEGLRATCLVDSRVGLAEMCIAPEEFDLYRIHSDNDISVGIRLISLVKLLKYGSNDHGVTMRIADPHYLQFVFGSMEEEISTFELKVIDIEEEYLGIPDIEYTLHWELPSKEFKQMCDEIKNFSDQIIIETDIENKRLLIYTRDTTNTSEVTGTLKLEKGDDRVSELTMEKHTKGLFALKYLEQYSKATAFNADKVCIDMHSEYPIRLTYSLGDSKSSKLECFLAPKELDEDMS